MVNFVIRWCLTHRFLVVLLRRGRFYVFAPYCVAIGLLTLAFALFRG